MSTINGFTVPIEIHAEVMRKARHAFGRTDRPIYCIIHPGTFYAVYAFRKKATDHILLFSVSTANGHEVSTQDENTIRDITTQYTDVTPPIWPSHLNNHSSGSSSTTPPSHHHGHGQTKNGVSLNTTTFNYVREQYLHMLGSRPGKIFCIIPVGGSGQVVYVKRDDIGRTHLLFYMDNASWGREGNALNEFIAGYADVTTPVTRPFTD